MDYFSLIKLEKHLTINLRVLKNLSSTGTKQEKIFYAVVTQPDGSELKGFVKENYQRYSPLEDFIKEQTDLLQEIRDCLASYTNEQIHALRIMRRDNKREYSKNIPMADDKKKPWL